MSVYQLIERLRSSDPLVGTQALQDLLSLGDEGEEALFARRIAEPPLAQAKRRLLRYVASRKRSISGRLIDRMKDQSRFDDGYHAAFLFAGLDRELSIENDLYDQITTTPLHEHKRIANSFMAWGHVGCDGSTLWHRVKDSDWAWEKLATFAFRASCASFARINTKDSWAIEQLLTHEFNGDSDLVQLSAGPDGQISRRAVGNDELGRAADNPFMTWRRGEVADEVLQSWAQHSHWRVRSFGARILSSLGYQRTVQPIVTWLGREPVKAIRDSLLHALERSDTSVGAEILLEHYLRTNEGAPYVAKAAWRATDEQRAVEALNVISRAPGTAGREAVVSLAKLHHRAADLSARLDSPDSYCRLNAALGFAYLADRSGIERLAAMQREVASPLEKVILSAALSLLGRAGSPMELNRELIAAAAVPNYFERVDIFNIPRYLQRAILEGLATGERDISDAWKAEIEPFEPKPDPFSPPAAKTSSSVLPDVKTEATQNTATSAVSKPTAVILTALEVETRAILRHLGKCDDHVVGGTVFVVGHFGDWVVAVAEVGAGNAGAAAIAERAVQRFKPAIALFVGVAGGIKDVSIGDVVIATKVYGYESGKETDGTFRVRPDVQVSSHALEQRGRAIRQKSEWKKRLDGSLSHGNSRILVGPIAAGEKVIASTSGATAEMLRQNYGDAPAVEMEGRGFLGGVHLSPDVLACVIRGISDQLDRKAEADASGSQERAADAASAVAMELLFAMSGASRLRVRSDREPDLVGKLSQETLQASVQSGEFSERSLSDQTKQQVVILVHGIRDFALWQNNIRGSLESAGFRTESINYGRYNLIKFLLPFPYFRRKAVDEVWNQIRIVKQNNPGARLSVIAHSFDTYVVARLMRENFDVTFGRVIFCGSVVEYKFPFEHLQNRFEAPIINEVGTRDIWPAIAESITTGYGSAGTYGFRRPLTRDRWHNGADHSCFLTQHFCNRFWIPWLADGQITPGATEPEAPSLWVRILSTVKLKYVLLLATLVVLLVGYFQRVDASGRMRIGEEPTLQPGNQASGRTEALVYGPAVRIATKEPNAGCQNRAARSCVQPQHAGGRLKAGSASSEYKATDRRLANAEVVEDSPSRVCVEFRVTTNACESTNVLEGRAIAVEQY
jgi:nucleoside phosphorylase